jgi:hypothetical protein
MLKDREFQEDCMIDDEEERSIIGSEGGRSNRRKQVVW